MQAVWTIRLAGPTQEIHFSRKKKTFLLNACLTSVNELIMIAEISTDGGTSDSRFMAKICDQVIEFT